MSINSFNILLLEENQDEADRLKELMENHRKIDTQKTLLGAIQQLKNNQPDVILLGLSETKNLEYLEKIIETAPDLPVVVLSPENDPEMALQALAKGAQDYLTKKDLQSQNLLHSLQFALARSQSLKARKKTETPQTILIENSPDMIWRSQQDGLILDVSPACQTLLGYQPEELIGLHIRELLHPEEITVFTNLQTQPQNNQIFNYRIRQKNGNYVWVESNCHLLERSKEIVGVCRSLPPSKQAEINLQEKYEFLEQVLNKIPDPVLVKDEQHRWVILNDASCAFMDQPRENLIGKSDYDFFPQEEADVFWQKDEEVFQSGNSLENEEQLTDANGNSLKIRTKKSVFTDKYGRKLLIGVIRDVTQYYQLQKELENKEEQLQIALELTNNGLWDYNIETEKIYCNEKILEFLGDDSGEYYKDLTWWKSIVHPDDFKDVFERLDAHIEGKTEVYEAQYRIQTKTGEWKWFFDRGRVVAYDAEKRPKRILGIFEDITEKTFERENFIATQKIGRIGCWEFNLVTFKVKWSEEVFRIFCLDPKLGEPTYEEHLKLLHPDDAIMWQETVEEAINKGQNFTVDFRIVLADGSIRYLASKGQPQLNTEGKVIRLFGTVQDITDRKEVEIALRRSESIYRAMARAIPNGSVILYDQDFRFTLAEGSHLSEIGIPKEYLENKTLREAFPAEIMRKYSEIFSRTLKGETINVEQKFSTLFYQIWSVPLKNEQGEIFGGLLLCQNISEYKKLQQNLQQQTDLLNSFIMSSPAGIAILDLEFRYLQINESLAQMNGLPISEHIGKTIWEIIPDKVDIIQQIFQKIIETSQPVLNTELSSVNNGNIENFLASYFPIYESPGNLKAIACMLVDISALKIAQQALRQSEERFRNLVANIPGIVYRCAYDSEWTDEFINETVLEITGYPAEDFINNKKRSFASIIHPEDKALTETAAAEAVTNKQSYSLEYRLITAAGEIKWVYEKGQPTFTSDGSVSYLEGILLDITDQKLAEEKLIKSQQFIEKIASTMPSFLYVYDLVSTNNIYANKQIYHTLGYTPEELKDMGSELISQLMHPEDYPRYLQSLEQLMNDREGQIFELEYRLKKPNNEWIWILSRDSVFLRDEKGIPIQMIGCGTDITAWKKSQEALRISEARLQLAIEASNLGIWDWNITHNEIYYSPEWKQMLEYEPEEIENSFVTWEKLTHPDDLERVVSTMANFFTSGLPIYEIEYRMQAKSGAWKWILVHGKVVEWDENKSPSRMIGTHKDVTEWKITEKQLRDREAFLRGIYEGVDHAIFVIDVLSEQEFIYAGLNPVGEKMINTKVEEYCGKTPEEVFNPIIGSRIRGNYLRCLDMGTTISYEEYFSYDNEYWLLTSLTPLQDAAGKIYRIIGVSHDITLRKKAELALQESEKREREKAALLEEALAALKRTQSQLVQNEKMVSLGQLVAGVAHEINNPVSFIYGNLFHANEYAEDLLNLLRLYQQFYPVPVPEIQSLIESLNLEFIQEDFINLISSMKEGTNRIRDIVLSLRNFSRLDEATKKAVDIHSGIDSTLMILQHRLKPAGKQSGILIVKEYGQIPDIECYAGQLNQVFMNIITNAIDALQAPSFASQQPDKKPSIHISTEALDNEQIVIKIADNGEGIPDDLKTKIFDPFFTTKPVGSGTGLGLAISFQIVEKHNGKLEFYSQSGMGTEFVITLPIR